MLEILNFNQYNQIATGITFILLQRSLLYFVSVAFLVAEHLQKASALHRQDTCHLDLYCLNKDFLIRELRLAYKMKVLFAALIESIVVVVTCTLFFGNNLSLF